MSKASNAVLALSRSFYGKSISQKQYDELLSCRSSNEIAAYLKANTEYAGEIESSKLSDFPPRVLEDLVQKLRFSRFGALCRYELAVGDDFYKYFIIKTEIEQILHCTLLIFSKKTESYLLQVHPFVDRHLSIDLFALGRAGSLEEVADCLEKTPYGKLYRRLVNDPFRSYLSFELAFSGLFEAKLQKLIEKIGGKRERRAVFETAARSRDCKMLASLYRALKYYPQRLDALSGFILSSVSVSLFSEPQRKKLAGCKTTQELFAVLEKSPYKDWAGGDGDFEKALERSLHSYCKKELRFSSYPPVVMLCYLILSLDECTNLIRIIEGCKYGISAQEIRKNLILTDGENGARTATGSHRPADG